MSPEEIERAIHRISWGGKFIKAKDSEGKRIPIIIRSLNVRERNFVEMIYNIALEEAKEQSLPTKFELYNLFKKRGLWTQDDDIKIESLGEKIKDLQKTYECSEGKQKKIFGTQLARLKKDFEECHRKREDLFAASAETHASEQKTLATIFCAAHDMDENRIWTSWSEFLDSYDDALVGSILDGFRKIKMLTEKEIRKIARSHAWRFRWVGAKNIGDLFGKPICDFDVEQQGLLYWSQMYDSVYETLDRPPDEIINDDDALDDWFRQQDKKDKQEKVQKSGQLGHTHLSENIRRHGEVFVVVNPQYNPNAPGLIQVDEMNDDFTRKFKQSEAQKIKKHGRLNEKNLRERGNHIARRIIGASDAVITGNSFGQARGGRKSETKRPGGSI